MDTMIREDVRDDPAPPREHRGTRLQRFIRGRDDDPAWARPSLLALLAGAALLYLWGLGSSGWANSYYAAAVQAATKSWKAFLFGSFDSSNFITVDKSPGALWVMDAAARIFGVNAWSVLVPQALEGVAAVGVLYATVRRVFTPAAGLIAGAVLALTPVATLMFRFNNPDALLTLLIVVGAYALVRAVEDARTRWLVGMGGLIGVAFLAKMLQAFLVVPVFGLVYLFAAPTSLRRRITQLLAAGASMLVAGGWWVAVVALTPASARPYVGGSQNNSIFNLIFGYNGLGRLTGAEAGSVGGAGGPGNGAGRWGATGLLRMFSTEIGGQISWLLPAALITTVFLVVVTRRALRTDARRASVLMWGGWLIITTLTFSLAKGIFHAYYTVALAPAIGALVGIGAVEGWKRRSNPAVRVLAAATLATTAVWSFVLLGRSSTWVPAVRWVVLAGGLVAAVALLVPPRYGRRAALAIAGVSLAVAFAGPAAYSLNTAATPHTGAIPSAGPYVAGARMGPGGPGGPGGAGGPGGRFAPPPGVAGPNAGPPNGFGPGGFPGVAPAPGGFGPRSATGRAGGPGGLGGLLDSRTPSAALVKLLEQNASSYKWVAATIGANSGAGVQLATGKPVLAIGGFNGTDPSPTLAQFQSIARQGQVHYYLAGGGGGRGGFGGPGGGAGGSQYSSQITSWVQQNYTSTTVGGVTVYNLTQPKFA